MPSSVILTATPRNSIGVPITGASVVWSNTDPSVATLTPVSPSQCRMDAVAAGSTDVVATVNGVPSNTCTVTVS